MSIDRRIGLETAIPQGMSMPLQSGGEQRQQASDADREAFQQALSQDGDAGTANSGDEAGTLRPFALFGAPAAPGEPVKADAGDDMAARLARDLGSSVERLLVGDGSSGRREVRLDLADELLPGVSVSVFEEEGRVVAAFVCASEASRERLAACAATLASELAQALSRGTLVRVTTDDPDDPCLTQATGEAST